MKIMKTKKCDVKWRYYHWILLRWKKESDLYKNYFIKGLAERPRGIGASGASDLYKNYKR
jgi:hypothetical protein